MNWNPTNIAGDTRNHALSVARMMCHKQVLVKIVNDLKRDLQHTWNDPTAGSMERWVCKDCLGIAEVRPGQFVAHFTWVSLDARSHRELADEGMSHRTQHDVATLFRKHGNFVAAGLGIGTAGR